MSKTILLVCFDFPPNYGIGGRRWAKFAKQLAKNGHKIHVIKANSSESKVSSWVEDVKSDNIIIHSIPSNYPNYVNNGKKSFFYKIVRKIQIFLLEKQEKGTIYDKTIRWESILLNKAKSLIEEHEIKNVIGTGAPFNIGYFLAKLKKENLDINFLFDYRDPWITAQNYGMTGLSKTKMKYEKHKQNYLLEHANYITAPNLYLLEEIRSSSNFENKKYDNKFISIPHFYDSDDLKNEEIEFVVDDKIRLIYGGTLYIGVQKYLNHIVKSLDNIKEKNTLLYSKLDINFYTPDIEYLKLFKNHLKVCRFSKPIGKKIFTELQKSDYVMIFLDEHNKDYKTTKFFEYLTFRKPYLFFGPKGYVADEIESLSLGSAKFDIIKDLEKILLNGVKDFNVSYPIESNSLENITKRLEKLLV